MKDHQKNYQRIAIRKDSYNMIKKAFKQSDHDTLLDLIDEVAVIMQKKYPQK